MTSISFRSYFDFLICSFSKFWTSMLRLLSFASSFNEVLILMFWLIFICLMIKRLVCYNPAVVGFYFSFCRNRLESVLQSIWC